jgi:hypothetical protein
MGATYLRGGLPIHINKSTGSNALEEWQIPKGQANTLLFRNSGANSILVSLDKDSADASPSIGYTVVAGQAIEWPAEIGRFWTRSPAGVSSFEAIAFLRRG